MQYAYAYQLNGTQTSGLDPDAKAYINAVVAAGATVSGAQRTAINNFYKTAKTGGWYSQLKRLYFPIWGGSAAPNAIDMISTLSGSFISTPTYANGYVNGNGTSACFSFDLSPSTLGLTTSSGSIYCLVTGTSAINGTQALGSVQDSSNSSRTSFRGAGLNNRSIAVFTQSAVSYSETDSRSVLIASRTTSTTNSAYKRTSSGFVTTVNEATAASPVLVTTQTMTFMAFNGNGTFSGFTPSSVRFGAYGMGLGLTAAQAESFSLALKNLWETCTGLTLP
jgi:hypothetical protein